jgi:hypothetical protein
MERLLDYGLAAAIAVGGAYGLVIWTCGGWSASPL